LHFLEEVDRQVLARTEGAAEDARDFGADNDEDVLSARSAVDLELAGARFRAGAGRYVDDRAEAQVGLRQRLKLLAAEVGRRLRRADVNDRLLRRRHRDTLFAAARHNVEVDLQGLADLDRDVVTLEVGKARGRHRHGIDAGLQVVKAISALRIRGGGEGALTAGGGD